MYAHRKAVAQARPVEFFLLSSAAPSLLTLIFLLPLHFFGDSGVFIVCWLLNNAMLPEHHWSDDLDTAGNEQEVGGVPFLFLAVACVAALVAVSLSLNERTFVAWVGSRCAVEAALSTYSAKWHRALKLRLEAEAQPVEVAAHK